MLREQILTIAFLADFFQFFQNNSNNTTQWSRTLVDAGSYTSVFTSMN